MVDGLLKSNLSRGEVRSLLIAAGWPESAVRDYLSELKKPASDLVLQVHGIAKSFAGHKVLDLIDFDVRAGEVFGIIGMSGAGKTTLLNLLVGYLVPDQGDVLFSVDDEALTVADHRVKKFFGFSTQRPSFYPKLSVLENLEHFGILYGMSGGSLHRRCRELLRLVELDDSRDVLGGNLSGGMQKRLDIACALIHGPEVLFLDEPTADLDPVMRKQLWDLIKSINGKGTTIVVASHFLAEMESLCSRIAVLVNHRIAVVVTSDELRRVYAHNFEVLFESESHDYSELMRSLGLYSPTITDDRLYLETASPESVLPYFSRFAKKNPLRSLRVERPSLGKVFEVLVRK